MSNKHRWTANIENKEKATPEDIKFIFEQAEKQLKDSCELSQIIVNRTTGLITINSAALLALIGFVITNWIDYSFSSPLAITAYCGVIFLFANCFLLSTNIRSKEYYITGSQPKDLFNDVFFVDTIPSEKRVLRLYVSEIESYQHRITQNAATNKIRWRIYNETLRRTISAPVILAILFLIFSVLNAYVF
jgi:hypothetical protein